VSFITSIFDFLRFNKRNWKAVVLCLMAGTVFWFFNALNKNYSANITFPLAFEYNHETYVPVRPLPTALRLNVSGLGWDLLRKSSGLKVPALVIPVERPTETRKIVGSMLPAHLATQLEGLQINFVLTDTLRIELDERVTKKFKVAVDSVRRYLHPDYGLFGKIEISPDSVWIEGPKQIVGKLPDVLTVALPAKNISKDFTEEIEIIVSDNESVKRNPPVIQVSFELEKLIEVNDHVLLDLVHASSKRRAGFKGKEINFTYRLPGSLLKKFSTDSIRATIDFKGLTKGNHKLVPLIEGLPEQAFLVKVDTVRVDI
jgi:YbbR domain-containing protein